MPDRKKDKPQKKRSAANTKNKVRKKYFFRLYVVGKTPNCGEAYNNLKKVCDEFIPNTYIIEIIDLLKFPQLAKSEKIIAIPTVVKKMPPPLRRIIGNLSNKEKVMIELDFRPDG